METILRMTGLPFVHSCLCLCHPFIQDTDGSEENENLNETDIWRNLVSQST